MSEGKGIVISGLSGRFPNSNNVDEFWDNLVAGTDMITDEPRRWPAGIFGLPERAGLLHDIASFDASFFGVSAKQAHQMDPQLRLLLEVAYEAILDSGYHPSELKGKKIGVYVGGSSSEAYDAWTSDADAQTGYGLLGCCRCMLANRVAFTFDFRGPSYTLDTACSSSMFALDAAVKSIQLGECDMALAAGVNLLLKPNCSLDFHRLSMLSHDGSCKVFDEGANGYVRAETVSAVVLCRENLSRRAYARVLGTRTNTDGYKSTGITYPNHEIQAELLSDLYEAAGVSPDDVYYLEMHGTGTQAGDTQEMLGVEKYFLDNGARSAEAPLYVGSVKSNMGHSEPSSGVAALTKILLSYHYKKIPANINFKKPNTKLKPLVDGTVVPVTSHLELRSGDIIGINSFGFGGANAHVILQGVSGDEPRPVNSEIPILVPYYNRRPEQTQAALCQIRDEHVTHDKLSYLHMISQGSAATNVTRGFVILNGVKKEPIVAESSPAAEKRPLWFVMTGMGAQWHEMGKDMLKYETFRRSIEECSLALASVPECTIDLHHLLTSPAAELQSAENAFVGLCAVQIGLVDLLSEFGLKPDGILGHSVGELVCGYADGCLDAGQTILASYFRGKCIKDAGLKEGGMAAVGLTWSEAASACSSGVVPACHNAEDSVTISGDKQKVSDLVQKLTDDGVFAKNVNSCGVAFHSPCLAPVGPQLEACLKPVIPHPKLRSQGWVCTSRKESEWDKAKYCDATYLSNNLVSPVWFHESLAKIPDNAIVVEIAACGLLQSILKRALPTCTILPLMKRKDPKCVEFFLNSIGKLWNLGVNPKFAKFYEAPSLPLVDLPPMSGLVNWDHSVQYNTPGLSDFASGSGSGSQVSYSYKVDTSDSSNPYHTMKDHVIDGRNLLPATGYLYLAWRSIATAVHSTVDKCPVTLQHITLHQATILSTLGPTTMTVTLSPGSRNFEVTSGDTLVVSGQYSLDDTVPSTKDNEEEDLGDQLILKPDGIYKEFRLRGYEYGPLYQGILHSTEGGETGDLRWSGDWVSFLDTMLQVQLIGNKSRALRLPTRIRELRINPVEQPGVGCDVKFTVNHNTKQCTAGGVFISGLHTTLAQRRSDLRPVMLETYDFAPYYKHVTAQRDVTNSSRDVTGDVTQFPHAQAVDSARQFIETSSLRNMLDIAQENILGMNALSVLEAGGVSYLKSYVENVLNSNPGRPICTYNVSVSSEREKEITDYEHLTESFVWDALSQPTSDKYNVIMTSSTVCNSREAMDNILGSLKAGGFLVMLTLEEDKLETCETAEIVASRDCSFATLSLIRSKQQQGDLRCKHIQVSSETFSWSETLQSAAVDDTVDRIWLQGNTSSGVQGLCNALRQEDCAHKIRSCLSSEKLSREELASVVEHDLVSNVLVKGVWGTYRHSDVTSSKAQVTSSDNNVTSRSAYVDTITRGDLSSLSWIQAPASPKSQNTITCEVSFASLNFRDIMIATGKLPPDALPLEMQGSNDCVLGLEFSGHVQGTKSRVMGILPVKALATRVVTQPDFTWEVPDSWSLEEAASVPVVYCTAYYSLITRGRLRRGESVLIHSGSGGVGQAAISISLSLGCEVFTTVGSQQKIDFLMSKFPQLSRDHILYSRSAKFEEDIMNMTKSKGVNVVLNSLAGDKLQASVRCLSRHGRFLEIGKYDMSENNPIGLAIFLKNVSFHGILLDALFEGNNSDWEEVRGLLEAGMKSGVVKPLPTTCFLNNQLEQAFRYMAQGKHIGKVVISTTDGAGQLPAVVLPKFSCQPDKSYIVTGGLGGFGLELVQWLAEHGARHVTVTSRSGAKSSYQQWVVSRLRGSGVNVTIATHDTTTVEGVAEMLGATSQPVTAIFHLAGILRDGLLESLTVQQFEEVFRAKVETARHMDTLSREICPELQHFVCFSSVVSGRGNSGQSNYAAANSVLERICEERMKGGYPGLAIQWGAIGDVGMAHSMVGNDANIGGTYPQRIWNCLSTMSHAMTLGSPVVSSIVLADKENQAKAECGSDLVVVVANIMGASDPSKLDHNISLGDLGLDSLMGVEVKQALERAEIRLSSKEIRALTLSDIKKLQSGEDTSGKTETKTEEKATESLVVLKTVADTVPLYLIHPITLDVEPLENIAKHLDSTVIAVQFTEKAPLDSLESLSSFYNSEIKKHRGEGKFRLGGYSFGAVLAFEMALQFKEDDLSLMEYLVLVDGSPNWVNGQIEDYKEANIKSKRSETLDKPTETVLGFIRRAFGSEPEGLYEKLSVLSPDVEAQVKVAMSVLKEKMPGMLTAETGYKMLYFSKLILLAMNYCPTSTFSGSVHLIKATDSYQVGEDYGLSKVCSGRIIVDSVHGDHETCVTDHQEDIASLITTRMSPPKVNTFTDVQVHTGT